MAETKEDEKALAAKKEEAKKLTIGQKIKKEIAHYWDGTKLLATEVKISSRLALKMAAGYELSRRENRQVRPTLNWPIISWYKLTCRLSFNEPFRTLDDSSLSPFSSLFLSQSSSFPWR